MDYQAQCQLCNNARMPPSPAANRKRDRLRGLLGNEFFAPALWKRRVALWSGGILVGLVAIGFARCSTLAYELFQRIVAISPWLPLLMTPLLFAALARLTSGPLRATRGSGIPQVIMALDVEDAGIRQRLLSLPVIGMKMLLTLAGLAGGASIGREGPTVHVGAGIMYWLGRRFGFDDPKAISRFILAGGGAGIAAAFNTPLAGVVFAIKELAGTFEHRFSGIVLTAVIIAGGVSLGLLGNYAYFGRVEAGLPLLTSWLPVLLCGLCGGIGGGLFSRIILLGDHGILGRIALLRKRWPVLFAGGCGLALATIGIVGTFYGTSVYGTGYNEARGLVQADHGAGAAFGLLKLAANISSYWAGIPGGIFSPALAVGAGMGNTIAAFLPGDPGPAVVLLGMAAFLAGVTQAPLTSAVISLELTANQNMVIPLMTVCLLARAISSRFCPTPVYHAFANQAIAEYEKKVETHTPEPKVVAPTDFVPPEPEAGSGNADITDGSTSPDQAPSADSPSRPEAQ
jgi:H+/Cl- antiporter ClcA